MREYQSPFLLVNRRSNTSAWIDEITDVFEIIDARHLVANYGEVTRCFMLESDLDCFETVKRPFIIYDMSGWQVSRCDLEELASDRSKALWIERERKRLHLESYVRLSGPVPPTGKRRWASPFCNPKTFGKRRAFESLLLHSREIKDNHAISIKVRRSRSVTQLPTGWSDIHRSDLYHRNWKRSRRTQWREVRTSGAP